MQNDIDDQRRDAIRADLRDAEERFTTGMLDYIDALVRNSIMEREHERIRDKYRRKPFDPNNQFDDD